MENPIRMADLGGTIIFGNTHLFSLQRFSFSELPDINGFSIFNVSLAIFIFVYLKLKPS